MSYLTEEHKKNKVLCKECKNETFNIMESERTGEFCIGCAKCGKGYIFGKGISSKNILLMMKDEL